MAGRLIVWGLPLAAACSLGQTPVTRPRMDFVRPPVHRLGPRVPTATAEPMLSTAAPAPASMYQMPSKPPQVSYQNGLLSIVAENSSLGDILREVHRSTGAAIDVPPNATERVVAHIGPGPARDVLASLLNGSAFNYVMLGSETDPTTLASVMLTMKAGGVPVETAVNVYQPPPQQAMMPLGAGPGGPVAQAPPGADDQADAEDEKDEDDSADEDQQDQAQGGATPASDASGAQPNANAGPKTPEQILEMLRQRPGQVNPQVPRPPNQPAPPDDNN